jgi:hypothetical protein
VVTDGGALVILVYSILAAHVLFIWCLCRAAARGDTYKPTARQLRAWRKERLDLNPAMRRHS